MRRMLKIIVGAIGILVVVLPVSYGAVPSSVVPATNSDVVAAGPVTVSAVETSRGLEPGSLLVLAAAIGLFGWLQHRRLSRAHRSWHARPQGGGDDRTVSPT